MITRINCRKYLNDVYAPGGMPGVYHVLSEVSAMWCGHWTVVGHVLCLNGKPTRVWMS